MPRSPAKSLTSTAALLTRPNRPRPGQHETLAQLTAACPEMTALTSLSLLLYGVFLGRPGLPAGPLATPAGLGPNETVVAKHALPLCGACETGGSIVHGCYGYDYRRLGEY